MDLIVCGPLWDFFPSFSTARRYQYRSMIMFNFDFRFNALVGGRRSLYFVLTTRCVEQTPFTAMAIRAYRIILLVALCRASQVTIITRELR